MGQYVTLVLCSWDLGLKKPNSLLLIRTKKDTWNLYKTLKHTFLIWGQVPLLIPPGDNHDDKTYNEMRCLFATTDSMRSEFLILNMRGLGLGFVATTWTMPAGKLIIISPIRRTWQFDSSTPRKQTWQTSWKKIETRLVTAWLLSTKSLHNSRHKC